MGNVPFPPGGQQAQRGRPAAPHWTSQEVRLMMALAEGGASFNQIANRIGRTKQSVQRKLIKVREEGFSFSDLRHCDRCGKQLARMNMADRCYACIGRIAE